MNKFKILIILVLMLGSTVSIQAQEKQNDATWEETVKFIKENMEYLDDSEYYKTKEIKLSVDFIIIEFEEFNITKDNYCEGTYTVPIIKINDINNTKKRVEFITEGEDVQLTRKNCTGYSWESKNGKKRYYKTGYFYLRTGDLASRLSKAFRHYVYLANEKRKESKF